MTKSTDTKNVKQIVRGILQRNYVADNLQLEIDLVSAWTRYVNEREEGLTPAESRAKITKEFGVLGFIGVSDEALQRARMMQIIMDVLGVEVNEDKTEWQTVITFCLDREQAGERVSDFRLWMKLDPYNSPKKHQIAQDPLLIKKTWRSAFEKQEHKTDEQPGEYTFRNIGI